MKKAFTLVEMIIVLAIIAVTSAVTLISINYLAPKKAEVTARKIITELTWLRQYAATQVSESENRPYAIARFLNSPQDGDYIEFYRVRPPGNWNLIKTVYLRNDADTLVTVIDPVPLPTTVSPPFLLCFVRIRDTRKAIPTQLPVPWTWGIDLPWDIRVDGISKVYVEEDTGHIRYVK